MLKMKEVYFVDVTLNSGLTWKCTLLNRPDALTLAAIVTAQNAPADFGKVLALTADIAVPAVGEQAAETPICVVDTLVGTVRVTTAEAYSLPIKRGRKPRTTPANPDSVTA